MHWISLFQGKLYRSQEAKSSLRWAYFLKNKACRQVTDNSYIQICKVFLSFFSTKHKKQLFSFSLFYSHSHYEAQLLNIRIEDHENRPAANKKVAQSWPSAGGIVLLQARKL